MLALTLLPLLLHAAPVTVAVPAFTSTDEVSAEKRAFFVEYFSEKLSTLGGLQVTTTAQVAAALGLERQRQLLGCSESGCSAELAGALGVESLVVGSIAKVGQEFAITVKAIDANSSKLITSVSARDAREERLLDFLGVAALQVHDALLLSFRGVRPAAPSRFGPQVWVPGTLGVVAGVLSATFFGLSRSAEARLRAGDPTLMSRADAHELALAGQGQQLASGILLGVSLAALATATILFVAMAPPRPAEVTP